MGTMSERSDRMAGGRQFRPEQLLGLDDRGPGIPDIDDPYISYGLDDWALLMDGLTPPEREAYRQHVPEKWRQKFFRD